MKKIFLFLQFTLVCLFVFVNSTKVEASTSDTIYYISDSDIVSVYQSVTNSFANYEYDSYYPYQLDDVISTGDYMQLFNNQYLGGGQLRNVVINGTMPFANNTNMDCMFVFEFVYLMPDIIQFSIICQELQANGCAILVIGSFSEYDYDVNDWNVFISSINSFYQKYPSDALGRAIISCLYQQNQSFYNVSLIFDRRVLGIDNPNSMSFSDIYKFNPLLRCMFDQIRAIDGFNVDCSMLINIYNLNVYMTDNQEQLYDIINQFIISRPVSAYSNEFDFLSELGQYFSNGFNYIISFFPYTTGFDDFVGNMIDVFNTHVFLIDSENQYPTSDTYSVIHVYRGGGIDIFTLMNYYGEEFVLEDYYYLLQDDENIWQLIQFFM